MTEQFAAIILTPVIGIPLGFCIFEGMFRLACRRPSALWELVFHEK